MAPEPTRFQDHESESARYATASIISTLQYIQDGDAEHLISVYWKMIDTVDLRILTKFGELSTEKIKEHPWMTEEINYLIEITEPKRRI